MFCELITLLQYFKNIKPGGCFAPPSDFTVVLLCYPVLTKVHYLVQLSMIARLIIIFLLPTERLITATSRIEQIRVEL